MWTDQIVLGKEEVQGSSGSIVSKKTINARNWKSQRLEVKDLKTPVGGTDDGQSKYTGKRVEVQGSSGLDCLEKTINARNWKSQRLEVKSQDLKTSLGTLMDRPNSTGKRGSAKAQVDRLSRKKITINARNWKSQKSRLENFLWAALMWIDQIVLGKEGSARLKWIDCPRKMTINARNGKSQRLEVKKSRL
ncbi:hypothetical protein TNCV_2029321 [Trichonephila clavipes]|nr:hypothetical protein TNCV_2029321 [Trichonephila clavipes]